MLSKLHSEITVLLICLPGSTIISKVFTPKTFAKYIIYVLRTPTLGTLVPFPVIAVIVYERVDHYTVSLLPGRESKAIRALFSLQMGRQPLDK